jgi:Spy/CpxP family protein refolding chaperone
VQFYPLLALLYFGGFTGFAQTIPSDKGDLEKGAGAGMAKYADLNGYPGPKHILEIQDTLKLSEQQKTRIQVIFYEMKANAVAKGKLIIEKEEKLEALFREGKASGLEVNSLAREIGKLRGDLRAVHMNAHIKAKNALTKEQAALYNSIRHGSEQHHSLH